MVLSFRFERLAASIAYQRWIDTLFLVGIPALLALAMAFTGGYVRNLGTWWGLAYVAALSFVPWWTAALATHAISRVFRRSPLWVATCLGALAAAVLCFPFIHEVNGWFRSSAPNGYLLVELSWPISPDRTGDALTSCGRAAVLWTAFNYIFISTLRWTGFTPPTKAPLADPAPVSRFQQSDAPWTSEADRELRQYLEEKLTPREISVRMQRTIPAIRNRISKLKRIGR